MKIPLFILLALLFSTTIAQAQYHRFSNPVTAPLHFNPGFAGSVDDYRVTLLYRNAVPRSHTFYGAYDQVSHRLHGAFGAEIFHDQVTDNYAETRISGIYAAKFQLGSRWTLSPALEVNFQRIRFDGYFWENGLLSDRVQLIRHGLNFSPALLLNTSNFYVGISADQLVSPLLRIRSGFPTDFQFEQERVFKLQSGYRFQPRNSDKWSLSITGLAAISNSFQELQGNLMYNRGWLLVGVGARYNDNAINIQSINYQASLGFKHRNFRLMGVLETHSSQFNLSLMMYLPRKKTAPSPESSGR